MYQGPVLGTYDIIGLVVCLVRSCHSHIEHWDVCCLVLPSDFRIQEVIRLNLLYYKFSLVLFPLICVEECSRWTVGQFVYRTSTASVILFDSYLLGPNSFG